jgi:murein L,D-transpeptidase YcbB/YkuD
MRVPLLLTSVLLCVVFAGCGTGVDNSQHASAIRELTSQSPDWVESSPLGRRLWKMEQAFYETRQYMPAWVDGAGTTPQWKDLVEQLKYSAAHGLDPARYGVGEFERLRESSQTRMRGTQFPVAQVPELDLKMTYAYLQYAADLIGWRHSPRDVHRNWLTDSKKEDLAARLTAAVSANSVRASLEELAPTHPQYKGLQTALAHETAKTGGRADQIRMNMERWRWAPRDLGDRYILVNVPAYTLQVIEGERPVLSMRVIVGTPDNQTPLFSDKMTYLVFSPYWNIPPDILREETLPRVARDPDFLRRNNIEIVGTSGDGEIDPETVDWDDESSTRNLRFRQRPGADNALGLVKFIFPNHFNVYLHDTPSDRLFFKENRALSHGCIRIEDPMAMAKYVMRDQPDWTEERIRTAMHAGREQTAKLKTPIPVHIGYWTAWVEADGKTVTYTADPYRIDPAHQKLLTSNQPARKARVNRSTRSSSDSPSRTKADRSSDHASL